MIGQLEQHAVEPFAHRLRALLEVDERVDRAGDDVPKKMYQLSCSQRDMLMTNCVNAGRSAPKSLNSALELRDHEHQQDDRDDDGHDQDRGRDRTGPS